MHLPEEFEQKMRKLLGEDYDNYAGSFAKKYGQTFRVNQLKTQPAELFRRFAVKPVPWCEDGFYYDGEERLSLHPFYYGGAYYIQEPCAMAPASFLPVKPGDKVLDLCAAPGGKTTALAAKLQGQGVLIANDISISRCKALLKNMEMAGVKNALITCETPQRLAERFSGYFDCVLVDAPCSGEGMFRKEPSMTADWSPEEVRRYSDLQKDILGQAASMVRPGGYLLYSTCTYAPEEDEQTLAWFLKEHPDFRLEALPKPEGVADGVPEWADPALADLKGCARFWPHRLRGEGHFVALLRRDGEGAPGRETAEGAAKPCKIWEDWARENLARPWQEILPEDCRIEISGEKVYAMLLSRERLGGLRVLRPGLLLGEARHDRLEPSQALAMVLSGNQARRRADLSIEEARHYLKGETLSGNFAPGWNLVTVQGYPLGWGKATGELLKNKYLKSWRIMK